VTEALARLELPRLTIDVDGSVVRTGATVGWASGGSTRIRAVADADLRRRLLGPWITRGGLFLPPTRGETHGEMENIRAYVTYEELTGATPTWDEFIDTLHTTGLRSLVLSLSSLATILHNDGVTNLTLQRMLRDQFVPPELRVRLLQLPNWNDRVLFFPQQVLFCIKAALMHSPDAVDERPDADFGHRLAHILLMATAFLDSPVVSEHDPDARNRIVSFVVRNSFIQGTERFGHMLARASLLYTTLPLLPELRASPQFTDLPAVFRDATGLQLGECLALGHALLVWFVSQSLLSDTFQPDHRALDPRQYFAATAVEGDVAQRFLTLLTHTYDSAQAAFRARPGDAARSPYDFRPFMDKPMYQIHEGALAPTSLAYLEARFTNGIFWTIHDALPSDGPRERFTQFFGQVFEAYVRQICMHALPDAPLLVRRVYPEQEYVARGDLHRTSDVAIVYGRHLVLLEATHSRLRLEETALAGDVEAFRRDVQKIVVAKAAQLIARIRDFRDRAYSFGGIGWDDIEAIHPVIVTFQSIPETTLVWDFMRAELQSAGVVEGPKTERLQLLDIEELEILESLMARGHSLWDVLHARAQDDQRRNIGMKNFIRARFPGDHENESLRQEYGRLGEEAKRFLFAPDRP
jgi:hypothetical protein